MRIIVCGTRTFADGELLFRTLDRLTRRLRKVTVVSGRAPGADLLGEAWAKARGHIMLDCAGQHRQALSKVLIDPFPADWGRHGRRAGRIRNEAMARSCRPGRDACVAFWDGKSKGTADMIRRARVRGLILRVVRYES